MKNIENKIQELIDNANQKIYSAELLALNGDYGTASSILVTAFEERTKATVLQLIDFGFPLADDISELDYVFKHHDSRHYIGFFVDCLNEVTNDLIPILHKIFTNKEYLLRILAIDLTEEEHSQMTNWINTKKSSFLSKIDFYQNIEKNRQTGLYIDVLNRSSDIKLIAQDDYNYIKERLSNIHILSDDLMKIKTENDRQMMESFEESSQEMDKMEMKLSVAKGLETIRKKRNGAFNYIREQINGM